LLISFFSEQLAELKSESAIKKTVLSPTDGSKDVRYIKSTHGRYQLFYNGYLFNRNHSTGSKTYWRCAQNGKLNCSARIVGNEFGLNVTKPIHNHEPFLNLEKTKCHAAKYLQNNP
jgi:hypothetical protein